MTFDPLQTPTKPVNRRTLKNEQGRVFRDEVREGRVVPIANNREVDAYLVPAEIFAEARTAAADLERVKSVIPLLIAAARTGVAVPSRTLEALGLGGSFDWRALNEFQAAFPIRLTHTEDGAPMPAPIAGLAQQIAVEAPDEELTIVE